MHHSLYHVRNSFHEDADMKNPAFLSTICLAFFLPLACIHSEDSHGGSHASDTSSVHAHGLDTVGGFTGTQNLKTKAMLFERGKVIFEEVCSHCHQLDGRGLSEAVPPLAESDFLMADRGRAIRVLFGGLKGPITVNGKTYDGVMPAVKGSDPSIAAVLTYVRNNFNGATDSISLSEVAAVRKSMGLE